jgi:hypothetical protein
MALIALAFLVRTTVASWRRQQIRRFGAFAAVTMAALVILGNIEWLRSMHAVLYQFRSVGLGWHIPGPMHGFWAFALGVLSFQMPLNPGSGTTLALLALASSCFVAGALRTFVTPGQISAKAALTVFGLMAVCFACFARDHFTHELGNTWALYKVCKWAFPLTVAVAFSGLAWLLRSRILLSGSILGVSVWAVCSALPHHHAHARWNKSLMWPLAKSSHPARSWRALDQWLTDQGYDNVYFLHEPHVKETFPQIVVGYLVYPRPLLNGWQNPWLGPEFSSEKPWPSAGKTALVMFYARPPFEPPTEVMPGGMVRLDEHRPWIFHLHNPDLPAKKQPDGSRAAVLGSRPLTLGVWAPCAGLMRLTFTAQKVPADSDFEFEVRTLQVRGPNGSKQIAPLDGGRVIEIPLQVPAGKSTIELACPEVHRHQGSDDAAARQPVVYLINPRIDYFNLPLAPVLLHH